MRSNVNNLNPAKERCTGIGLFAFHALAIEPPIREHLKTYFAQNLERDRFLQMSASKVGNVQDVFIRESAPRAQHTSCVAPEGPHKTQRQRTKQYARSCR